MGITINLVGNKYNRLTVIAMHSEKLHGRVAWLCKCECGNELIVGGNALRRNNTRSCGCLKLEMIGARRRTHGKSKTLEYQTWCAMKQRCCDQNHQDFHIYGGRGITICERWINSFENFLADMGKRPDRRSTLERKEVNGNYCPENCTWVTQKVQTRNKRNNHLLTVDGETKCIAEWAELRGLRRGLISNRLSRGWPADKAVNTPLLKSWHTKRRDNYSR